MDLDHDDDAENADDLWRWADTLVFEPTVPDLDIDHLGALPPPHNHYGLLRLPVQHPFHHNFITGHPSYRNVSHNVQLMPLILLLLNAGLLWALQKEPEHCLCRRQSFQRLHLVGFVSPVHWTVSLLQPRNIWQTCAVAIIKFLKKNHGSGLVIVVFVLFQSCSDASSFSQQWPLNIQTQKTCSLCISGVFQGGCQVPKEPVSPTRLSPNVCPPWKARRQGPPTPTSLPQRGLPPPFHLSFNISTLPEECQSN